MTKIARLFTICLALATPAVAHASQLGVAGPPDINLFRIALSLLLCLFIAVGAAFMLKRRSGQIWLPLNRAQGDGIKIKETRRISLQAELCRFECGEREYLIVVTPQSATVLNERPAGTLPA